MNLAQKITYDSLIKNKLLTKEEFQSFLKDCCDCYYTNTSLISDNEFDKYKKKFREQFGHDPVGVGTSKQLSKGFLKVTHEIAMGSLEEFDPDKGVENEIKKWVSKYADKDELCTSEKLDGLSVSILYKEGNLTQALTRGDGQEGDDITRNVLKMGRVKKKLDIPYTGYLRGEIVLRKSMREKHFPHYANERNGAVGLIKKLSGEGSEHLDAYFFKVESIEHNFKTEYESLDFIKNILGEKTPRYYKVNTKTLLELHKRYESEVREKLDYLLDGLVVSINDRENQDRIIENPLLPEYARKFKFTSEEAITELQMVQLQVGRTGAITPVGILTPVSCGGTLITKATLHNFEEIKRLGIKAGDIIKLVRSKDVIPKIVGKHSDGDFSEEIQAPKECPICATKVQQTDTVIYCPNDYCSAKVSKGLTHWLNVMNIKNISEKIVEALIDAGKLQSVEDFYKLKIEDIASLEGQGTKNATRILSEINSKKELTAAEILSGLNIRNLSVKRAEILEDQFGSLENILEVKTQDIINLDGFEETLATFITTGLKTKKNQIKELLKYIKIKKKVEGSLTGKQFCFSGFRNDKLEQELKAKGGRIASGVSKKLDYLIVKNKEGTTSKLAKARDYGINIIDENDLEGLLRNTLF